MKKHFFFLILFTSLLFFLTACCSKKNVTSSESKTPTTVTQSQDYEKSGYVKATVINYEVNGCGFLIQLEDGKKLQAINLSSDFRKDKLSVWVKYSLKKGGTSVCMAGQMVELSDIQLRK